MNDKDGCFMVGGFVGIILLLLGGFVFCCRQESKTYNRLTGANTTTWDAMWVELRVQDAPRKD